MRGIKKSPRPKSLADQEEGGEGTLYLLHDFKSLSYQEDGVDVSAQGATTLGNERIFSPKLRTFLLSYLYDDDKPSKPSKPSKSLPYPEEDTLYL